MRIKENRFYILYMNTYINEKKSIRIGTRMFTVSSGKRNVNIILNVPDIHLANVGKSASCKIVPHSFTGASMYEIIK